MATKKKKNAQSKKLQRLGRFQRGSGSIKYKASNKEDQRLIAENNHIHKIQETWKFENPDFKMFLKCIEDKPCISEKEIYDECRGSKKGKGKRVSKDKIDLNKHLTRAQIKVFTEIALERQIITSSKGGKKGGKIWLNPHKSSISDQLQSALIVSELEALDLELNNLKKDSKFSRGNWFTLFELRNEFLKLPMKYYKALKDFENVIGLAKTRLEKIDKIIQIQKKHNNNADKIIEYLEELSEENDSPWLHVLCKKKPDSSTEKVLGKMEGPRHTIYKTLMNYLPKK